MALDMTLDLVGPSFQGVNRNFVLSRNIIFQL